MGMGGPSEVMTWHSSSDRKCSKRRGVPFWRGTTKVHTKREALL